MQPTRAPSPAAACGMPQSRLCDCKFSRNTSHDDRPMTPDSAVSTLPTRLRPAIWLGTAVVGLMLAGTIVLWARLGSAVFFEMIAAGFAACF
jgi:hypothetical protein